MVETSVNPKSQPHTMPVVGLFSVSHFLNDTYSTVYPALVPFMMVLLHWSVTVAALVGAVGWASQVVQPLLGRFVDARPNRLYAGLALVIGSLAVLVEPLTRNYGLFLALIILAGFASSLFHPPALSLMGQLSGKRRGTHMATFLVSGNIGRAVGPLATSALILWLGGVSSAAWIAIPGLLMAAGMLIYAPSIARPEKTPTAMPAWRLLSSRARPLMTLLGLSATRALATSSLVALLPVWYHLKGGTALESSAYIGVLLFVGSFGNGLGGFLSDRWPRIWILSAAAMGSGLSLWAFVGSRGLVEIMLIGLVGLFAMSTSSVTMMMGQELFPESRAMASGIALGVGNACGALLVAVLSLVAGRFGVPAALYGAAILVVMGTPLAFLYERWVPETPHAEPPLPRPTG